MLWPSCYCSFGRDRADSEESLVEAILAGHRTRPFGGSLSIARKGQRTLRNAGDGIFRDGGTKLLLKVANQGKGYAAAFDAALQMA